MKKALLTVVLAGDAAVSTAARRDLIEAAQELEAMGEPQRAAEAYELAKDPEGEARALAKAGDVDKLETVLFAEEQRQHKERARRDAHAEIEMLVSCGKRREALTVASQLARAEPDDHEAREKVHSLDGRRAKGAVLRVVLRGRACSLVLGESVVVGRTEGALTVPSHAISRRHLVIQRDAGRTTVCDLSSRNGTQLRGMSIAGAMDVGDGLELKLGHAVPLGIAPSAELGGAMAIELGGERYLAPLGPCRLGIGAWRLEVAADDWVELVTSDDPPAFLGPLSLAPRVTLLVGDSIASARGDEPVLRVVG